MNILVVGNGAREHAILWKIRQSPHSHVLYCAPGNAGTASLAENVPIAANQVGVLVDWSTAHAIDLVIVGPEEPLALGLVDLLRAAGLVAFGPTARAARIESSKAWAKDLMRRAGVPTAAYAIFNDSAAARSYVQGQPYPLVLKADGLAAGKGVVIATTPSEAIAAIEAALELRVFGDAGRTLVIEEFLRGDEVSLLAFVDGRRAVPLVAARDHKRAYDGDEGPNTGGMGAFAPTCLIDRVEALRLASKLIDPIIAALAEDGVEYRGLLYAGLILTENGPRVIEYNCRFGDPETQVILPLLGDDLVDLACATALGQLPSTALTVEEGYRCGVVIASGGYPGPYRTGLPIRGLNDVDERALVFHAGTLPSESGIVTAGGRVVTVVGQGPTLSEARAHAYTNARRITFDAAWCRGDIGVREVV